MDNRTIIDETASLTGKIIGYRRHLHAHPELSFRETRTAEYIESILEKEGIFYRRIAGTGVLAFIKGQEPRKAVVLRADTDALPVEEKNETEYCSTNKGVMHACGHDMHTAALLGALTIINRHRGELPHSVFGLFQPGEEVSPGGASMVLAEKPFDGYDILAVIGQHTDTELPTGVFGFRKGIYMASSDEIRITVKGKGGHAAMPDRLLDPVPASAAIITALQQVVSRRSHPSMPTVLSIGKVIADGATNVIPDNVFMEGTLRTFDEGWRQEAKNIIASAVENTARAHSVQAEMDVAAGGYPCVYNDPELTGRAVSVIENMFGGEQVRELQLRTTAEDFGYYGQHNPSVFYRFGVAGGRQTDTFDNPDSDQPAGECGNLHSGTFNPDERSLPYAAAGLISLAFRL